MRTSFEFGHHCGHFVASTMCPQIGAIPAERHGLQSVPMLEYSWSRILSARFREHAGLAIALRRARLTARSLA
jgi:hypothetical protein